VTLKHNLFTLVIIFSISIIGCSKDYLNQPSANKDTMNNKLNPVVIMETSAGTVNIELWPDIAPKTVKNFVGHVENGYYDGIIFHRVIKGFMIQGGDPTGTGGGGQSIWGDKFEDEVTSDVQFDSKGLIAMANSGPNTNGSQFFITTKQTPHLNMRHTIFGKVIVGYNTVITDIENTQTGPTDRPIEEQKIIRATMKE